MKKPRRGGGIRLTIRLGSATYVGMPIWTPATARIHLENHPEAILVEACQWDPRLATYVQVDIDWPQTRTPLPEGVKP